MSAPECQGDVCITCSDTAVQVTVVRLLDDSLAEVDTGQGLEEVSVALVTAAVGASPTTAGVHPESLKFAVFHPGISRRAS